MSKLWAVPSEDCDVVVIGAGPAGSVSAALLKQAGLDVVVLERARFPRFVIGESLLPICNEVLQEAGLFERVRSQGYQVKTGAVFLRDNEMCEYDFADQFTKGATWSWQVPRAHFDNVLVDGIRASGVPVHFECEVTDAKVGEAPSVSITGSDGKPRKICCRFVVDASGYGRVLPRLLHLDKPSDQPRRRSLFAHVSGDKRPGGPNAGRIWIIIHDEGAWLWIIPFADGRTSVGVVADPEFYTAYPYEPAECLEAIVRSDPNASRRLAAMELSFGPISIESYSIGIKQLYGEGYCVVGNATEFLDPVFSSGVSLAMQSARRASGCVIEQLTRGTTDWQGLYADYMMRGVDTFRSFVNAWYDRTLHTILFAPEINPEFKRMICSALAGYVWDLDNPFVSNHQRKLSQLARIIDKTSGKQPV